MEGLGLGLWTGVVGPIGLIVVGSPGTTTSVLPDARITHVIIQNKQNKLST